MRVYKGETFADVYKTALKDVLNNPQYESSPRDMSIKEVTGASLIIQDPECCLYENKRRSSQFKYIAAELLWYFSGRDDADFISRFAKFWETLKNDDGTVNSAYGNLIFNEFNDEGYNQWYWAYESLVNDKDSRQAVLHFNTPKHQFFGNKDFVCTLYGIFQIRNNRLNFTVHMRSNDLILGTPTDIAFFCLLQQQMLRLLLPIYPNLKLGTYTHNTDSLHIYERHFQLVNEMLSEVFIPLTYPQLDIDLVNINGASAKIVDEMINKIENENILNIVHESNFMDWINDRLNE